MPQEAFLVNSKGLEPGGHVSELLHQRQDRKAARDWKRGSGADATWPGKLTGRERSKANQLAWSLWRQPLFKMNPDHTGASHALINQ